MSSLILRALNHFETTNTLFGGKEAVDSEDRVAAFSDSTVGTARGIDMAVIITFLVVGILGSMVGLSPAGAYALIGLGGIGALAYLIKGLYDRREALGKLCTCGGTEVNKPDTQSTQL